MTSFRESQMVEKLNQNNYSNWKFKMQMLLIKEDLYELVTNNPPDPITDDWHRKDNKARALINLFIEDSEIINVKNLTTARDTFETLKNIHERSNLSSKLFLLRKLYNTKLEENGNMSVHITKILETVDKLHAIGEEISDSHISALLLCSVPKSYDTLITALEARPEVELNSNFIRSKLIDEYSRRIEHATPPENAARAFHTNKNKYVNHSNYSGNNFRPNNSNFHTNNLKRETKFCTYCKKRNHSKLECWHLKKKGNNLKNKNIDNSSSLCLEVSKMRAASNETENINSITTPINNFAFIAEKPNENIWIIDSGSSSHISNDKTLFTQLHDENKTDVVIADGKVITSYGSGEIKLTAKTSKNETNIITLKNVLFVPDIKTNLLSVKSATQNGCTVIFDQYNCNFMYADKTCLTGYIKNNLYEVSFEKPESVTQVNTVSDCKNENCIQLWHRRMGHRNVDSIKQLITKELATGVKLHNCQHDFVCEVCTKSKLTAKPYPKQAQHRAKKTLELIHSDLCGPIQTPTIGGKTYLLTFIDDFSRYTTIYLLSHKNEVLDKLKEYVAITKNKFGRTPGSIRTDNGKEYVNRETEKFLNSMGIKHQLSIPYCSPQNGVAERKNRSLMEMTRCLLNEANLNHKFWGEAVNTATYLQNRLPTKPNEKTPFEHWENYKPDLSHLKLFGCKAYTYVNKQKRTKLDDTAKPGTFVGYDNNSKGYRIYTEGKNITISRTVKFLEDTIANLKLNFEEKENFNQKIHDQEFTQNNEIMIDLSSQPGDRTSEPADDTIAAPRRSERSNRGVPPDRLIYMTEHKQIKEPKSWTDLQNIHNPVEKTNWLNATKDEIKSLKENKTWTLVDPPQGKTIIGCKWTFKSKYNSEGKIEKYKARLVAKGFSQKFGEDYDETFAPVVSHTTIRALLAAAVHKKLQVTHIDVKTAFLHGELNEEVYMSQPEGYIIQGKENKVCKLGKAIYGLKQAARAWQLKIEQTLKNLNFTQSTADACLYSRKTGENIVYVIVYVDDILIAGSDRQINETIISLRKEFEIKNLGPVKYYLGINIRKTEEGHYALNQKMKIEEIISKFNLNDAKPCDTPMEPGYLKCNDEDNVMPNNTKFRQAIGALLYVATITRPDILAAVNILSRRNERPREKDWTQVKRTIRYLKTTKTLELIINPSPEAILSCYTDADWAGDKTDRKSTSGNLLLLGKSPINWISKKQNCVALSSAEAEYVAAANAAQEILWTIKLLEDLDMPQQLPITIYEDNQSTIKMIDSPKYTSKTKHIDIKYNCVRDLKSKGTIDFEYCPTNHMIADALTKPLPKPHFERLRSNLQLSPEHRSAKTGAC